MPKRNLMFIFYSFFIVIILNYLFLLLPAKASTGADLKGQLDTAGVKAWGTLATPTSLAEIIQYAISAFLGLLGIIFVVLIIYSGYNWMTAAGDEDKVTKAKATIQRAVIGLIIIIAAYSITYFVFISLPGGGGGGGEPL